MGCATRFRATRAAPGRTPSSVMAAPGKWSIWLFASSTSPEWLSETAAPSSRAVETYEKRLSETLTWEAHAILSAVPETSPNVQPSTEAPSHPGPRSRALPFRCTKVSSRIWIAPARLKRTAAPGSPSAPPYSKRSPLNTRPETGRFLSPLAATRQGATAASTSARGRSSPGRGV